MRFNQIRISIVVVLIVVVTTVLQVYLLLSQYKVNSRVIGSEIQTSLEKAVMEAQNNLPRISTSVDVIEDQGEVQVVQADQVDDLITVLNSIASRYSADSGQLTLDDVQFAQISNDFALRELDSLFQLELKSRDIDLAYNMFYREENIFSDSILHTRRGQDWMELEVPMMPFGMTQVVVVQYYNDLSLVLKRSIWVSLTSFFLLVLIGTSLLYLVRLMDRQKKISAIKNDFISNVSHEFKTPISIISGAIEYVLRFSGDALAPQSREHLTAGVDQLQKLNFIMENLIQTAAAEGKAFDLRLQELEVNSFIRERVRQFSLSTAKQIEFKSNADEIFIQADRFHLDNMLSNLIDNAIKYGGERIEIETILGEEGHWTLSVSDNGEPIAEVDRPHVFNKFYRGMATAQMRANGTGIGLFYVKTIVERHGGRIRLLHGKTFLIEL